MARILFDLPDAFEFSTRIPLRIQDLNYGGHMGNDAVLSILHESRMQYLAAKGLSELDAAGVSLIMADAGIIYKGEGFWGDLLDVEVQAFDYSTRGFDLAYRISCLRSTKKHDIAVAKTAMLCFDYQTRKVVSMPLPLKEKLQSPLES